MNNKRLRIAVLGTRGIPDVMGGVETHCQALYPRLVEKGHRVTVFARRRYVTSGEPYEYHGVKVIPLWAPKRKHLEALIHTTYGVLKVAAQEEDFDILHIHAVGPALLAPLARFLGLKVVLTHHGPDYERQKWGPFARNVLRLGERLGCHFSHSIIAISRHIQKRINELYHREGHYIPNGVLLPEILSPGEALNRWRLTPRKYIFTVGRLVPEKGFHDLLEAYRPLDTDWNLVIAGAADHEDRYCLGLKEQAARDNRVIMTGFIKGEELGEVYSNAGIFVLPSYHEGLPIALLEAMSYNLPILASDIPSNRELAEPNETFPAGDINALRRGLEDFLSAPRTFSGGRSRIETEFNWNRVSEQTEKVFQGLFEKRPEK